VRYEIAIVGVGPRGLSMFERIVALYLHRAPQWSLHIHLIDPAEPGQGAHPEMQPTHLLTNTVAGQITLFTDDSVRQAGPIRPGPTLRDWARAAGYRRVAGHFVRTGTDGEDIDENDYLPRALLGGYLTFVYDTLIRELPEGIHVTHHRRMAEDIKPLGGGRHLVCLADGYPITADAVVMTTGHSENCAAPEDVMLEEQVRIGRKRNPKLLFLRHVEPIRLLQAVSPDACVYIQGMGLTAYDIISELTIGRGGRFITCAQRGLRYEASGREPRMLLGSRQGLPFSARAVNQKSIDGLHRPLFFTKGWMDDLRDRKESLTTSRKLDYEIDLWPTLRKEMCYVYDKTTRGQALAPAGYLPSSDSERAIAEIFSPLGSGRFSDERAYHDAVVRYVKRDLEHAKAGNVSDPVKAATDVLRDLRDHVRYAVDYAGLTEESHRHFLERVMPVMYRISAGAPKERNMQLLALIDCGLAAFGPGPGPVLSFDADQARFVLRSSQLEQPAEHQADVVIRARIDCAIFPEQQPNSLIQNMLRSGTIRPFVNGRFHPGGIDVDTSQNVIDARGRANTHLWALGIITEGPNYCTYVLPRTQVNSRFLQFSGRCALALFAQLDGLIRDRPASARASSQHVSVG